MTSVCQVCSRNALCNCRRSHSTKSAKKCLPSQRSPLLQRSIPLRSIVYYRIQAGHHADLTESIAGRRITYEVPQASRHDQTKSINNEQKQGNPMSKHNVDKSKKSPPASVTNKTCRTNTTTRTDTSTETRIKPRQFTHLSTSHTRTSPSSAAARPAPSKIPSCVMAVRDCREVLEPLRPPPPASPPLLLPPLSPARNPLRRVTGWSDRDHTRTSPSPDPVMRIDSERASTAILVTGALSGWATNEVCRR